MRLLLDTQIWLWMITEPEWIEPAALEAVLDPLNERWISLGSYWEVSIKAGLGKLSLPEPLDRFLPARLAATAASSLEIKTAHVILAGSLPHIHRDPFDRLLVAQARIEGLRLVTADGDMARYDVDILWASRRRARPSGHETSP